MRFCLILIFVSISFNAYAVEPNGDYSFFYNQNHGSSFVNVSNLTSTTITDPNLDLSAGNFGLTGTYTKKELGIILKKYQFGIFNYKNNAYGTVWSRGTGSSDSLFDHVSSTSRVALTTSGTGISLGLPSNQTVKPYQK